MILRRIAEPLAFLSLAAAVHAAVWVGYPGTGAPAADGGRGRGGTASLTLSGGADLAQMAAEWRRPPAVATLAPDAPRPAASDTLPRRPSLASGAAAQESADVPPTPGADVAPVVQVTPPESPARPAGEAAQPATETASGSGAAPTAGAASMAPQGPGAAAEAAQTSQMADWAARIRARVERRKSYPRAAQAQRLTGTVTLSLSVGADGALLGFAVIKSSGYAVLDEAALAALRGAGKLPPAPKGLERARYAFTLPVTFSR